MGKSEHEWSLFQNEWSRQYSNAIYILTYLKSYPVILEKCQITNLIDLGNVENAQKEWIRLYSRFDNALEFDFFRPYWIPLQENSYDLFMDISNKNYPIFEANYFFFKPYRWYKKYIVEDIADLLLAHDTGIDMHKLLWENDKKRWDIVDGFFAERRKMGLNGDN